MKETNVSGRLRAAHGTGMSMAKGFFNMIITDEVLAPHFWHSLNVHRAVFFDDGDDGDDNQITHGPMEPLSLN